MKLPYKSTGGSVVATAVSPAGSTVVCVPLGVTVTMRLPPSMARQMSPRGEDRPLSIPISRGNPSRSALSVVSSSPSRQIAPPAPTARKWSRVCSTGLAPNGW